VYDDLQQDRKQVVLVTGAGSGLGFETTLYLAGKGYAVWGSVLNAAEAAALAEGAERRQVPVRVLHMDVTQQHEIDAAVRVLLEKAGRIDGLVQFAGIGLSGFFEDLSLEEVRRLYDVNLFGVMAVTQAVLPHMRATRAGRIVITSSVLGRIGAMATSGYVSSKFAVEGFAECLAQEVAPFGIYVSLLEPGLVRTPMHGINRNRAKRALDPNSSYYAWFSQHEEMVDNRLRRSRVTTVDVAWTVHKILTSSRPRLRYVVGLPAKLILSLRRHIPDELFERLLFSYIRRRVTAPRQQS
jgi:NAD(P)-dependent dehydrogenase (short-subunit alcohol dehydrogenase family)